MGTANEPSLRARKRKQSRQELISAATRLFEDKGYDQTTVAEVAAAAAVSTKTFFNYFASNDEVLFRHLSGMGLDVCASEAPVYRAHQPGIRAHPQVVILTKYRFLPSTTSDRGNT